MNSRNVTLDTNKTDTHCWLTLVSGIVSPSTNPYFELWPTFTLSVCVRISLPHNRVVQTFLEVMTLKRANAEVNRPSTNALSRNPENFAKRSADLIISINWPSGITTKDDTKSARVNAVDKQSNSRVDGDNH